MLHNLFGNDTSIRAHTFRRLFITMALVGICFVPYFVVAVLPAARGGGGAWIADSFGSVVDLFSALPKTLWAFLPAGGYPLHLRGLSILSPDTIAYQSHMLVAIARTVPAVLMIAAFLWVVRCKMLGAKENCSTARAEARGSEFNFACGSGKNLHIVFAGLTLLPLMLALLYSFIAKPNYLVGRYDLVAE